MNYTALVALIESTTQNNDPTFIATIPDFVRTAERRIYMESHLPSTRKVAVLATPTAWATGVVVAAEDLKTATVAVGGFYIGQVIASTAAGRQALRLTQVRQLFGLLVGL